MSRLTNDLIAISDVLAQNVTDLFAGMLSLVGILIMMFSINFWLALASMIVFPLMLWLVGWVGKRTRGSFREYQMRIGQLNGQLEEMFGGQRVILAFGQEASNLARFDIANEAVRTVGIHANSYAMLIPPLMGILSNANIAILAGLGGWMTLRGWATVGTIAAFYTYSRRFAGPLRQLGNLYNQVQVALAGAERVFETLDTHPDIPDAPDAVALGEVAGEVIFDHVDFGYVPGVPIIKDMSLVARPGQTIALVGPTGAGKTTIVNLLTRFYDIDGGADHDRRSRHPLCAEGQPATPAGDRAAGYLSCSPESVMENIRYGRLDATDEEVDRGRPAGQRRPVHPPPARGLRHQAIRAGQQPEPGAAPVARHRPRRAGRPAHPHPRRGDEQRGHAHRGAHPGSAAAADGGAHQFRDRPPSEHHPQRRPDPRDQRLGASSSAGRIEELLAQRGFYYTMYISQFKGQVVAETVADSVQSIL